MYCGHQIEARNASLDQLTCDVFCASLIRNSISIDESKEWITEVRKRKGINKRIQLECELHFNRSVEEIGLDQAESYPGNREISVLEVFIDEQPSQGMRDASEATAILTVLTDKR